MIDVGALPPDLALMRIENDNIQAMAAARPRDLEKVKNDLLNQLKIFPAICEKLIYSKPVGKDDDGVMQFARDLSVRAAEMIAEAYGYNRIAIKTTIIDDTTATVEATFVDYQRGRLWTVSNPLSRIGTKRGGGTYTIPMDRFYDLVCKAAGSKAVREVVMRCVPPGLKQCLFEAAEKEMAKLLTPAHMEKILASFATKGVTAEQVEHLIGRTQKQGWVAADRQKLAEVWAAFESGEATVAEIFGGGSAADHRPEASKPANGNGTGHAGATAPAGAVSGDDLMNPKGGAEAHSHREKPKAAETAKEAESAPDRSNVASSQQVGPGKPSDELGPRPRQAAENPAGHGDAYEGPEDGDGMDDAEKRAITEAEILEDLAESLRAETGIIGRRRLGERYYGKGSTLSDAGKTKALVMTRAAEEEIRDKRGEKSNKGQQGSFA